MPRFEDIPKFIDSQCNYKIDVGWRFLKSWMNDSGETFVLDPDFQRGHVWTIDQKEKYLEYRLQGGSCSNTLIFACENFKHGTQNPWYLVDGLQRLTAIQEFLDDKIKAFGYFYCEFEDGLNLVEHRFQVKVIDANRKDMLQLYLDLNTGGTPHSKAEIDKVRKLLKNAR